MSCIKMEGSRAKTFSQHANLDHCLRFRVEGLRSRAKGLGEI